MLSIEAGIIADVVKENQLKWRVDAAGFRARRLGQRTLMSLDQLGVTQALHHELVRQITEQLRPSSTPRALSS